MSADRLRQSLGRIEAGLLRIGLGGTVELLRKPLPRIEVDRRMARFGMSSGEPETRFAWHDGTDFAGGAKLGDADLFPGFCLLSVDEALSAHSALSRDSRTRPTG